MLHSGLVVCFIDIKVADKPLRRVIYQLHQDITPTVRRVITPYG
jgi:hypothetical protein